MELDKNPFPKIDVLPRLAAIGRFLVGTMDAETAYPSDHRRLPGAADAAYIQPELPFRES